MVQTTTAATMMPTINDELRQKRGEEEKEKKKKSTSEKGKTFEGGEKEEEGASRSSSCSWTSGDDRLPSEEEVLAKYQQYQLQPQHHLRKGKVSRKLKDIFNKYLNRCYVSALDPGQCQCGGSGSGGAAGEEAASGIYNNSSVYSFYQPALATAAIREEDEDGSDSWSRTISSSVGSSLKSNDSSSTLSAKDWACQLAYVGSSCKSSVMVRAISEGPRSHFLQPQLETAQQQQQHFPIPSFPRSLSLEPSVASNTNSPPASPRKVGGGGFSRFSESHYDSMPLYEGIGEMLQQQQQLPIDGVQETIDKTEDAIKSMEKAIKCIDNVLDPSLPPLQPRRDSQGRIQYDVISVLPKPPSIPLPPPRRQQQQQQCQPRVPTRSHSFRDRARSVMNANICSGGFTSAAAATDCNRNPNPHPWQQFHQNQWCHLVVTDNAFLESGKTMTGSPPPHEQQQQQLFGFLNNRARSAPPIQPGFSAASRRGW